MGFIRKNLIFILIFLLAFFLRFNYDLFINGYNFDELAMVSIAKQSFPFGILKACSDLDYHAPFYYFIIHPFTNLSQEWVYIRLLNLIFSLVNVFIFYKIGTLIKDKKTGLILALILSVNHLEISTVSFVKFYCFCFMLFSANIYYLVKIFKKNEGYNKFALINICFILSSTLGFLTILTQYLILFIVKKNKKTIYSFFISLIGFILYLPIFFKQFLIAQQTIISPHSSYSGLSFLAFYNLLNDYLTPLVNYCCNLITIESCVYLANFIKSIKNFTFDYLSFFVFLFLSLIPILISIYLVIIAIKNSSLIKKLNTINLIYLIVFVSLVIFEKTGLIPIYLYPFGIVILISLGAGFSYIKNKKIMLICLIYLFLAQIIIPNTYPSIKRGAEKAKIYYVFEEYFKNKDENTHYIVTNGGRFLKKYYNSKKIIDFDSEKMKGSFKKEFISYLFGEKIANTANKNNFAILIKNIIFNDIKNPSFEEYFNKTVLNNINKGEKIILCFYADEYPFLLNKDEIKNAYNKNYYPHLSKATIKNAISEEIIFDSGYLSEIIMSYSNKYLIELLDKNFEKINVEQYQKTQNDKYIKTFEGNTKENSLYLAQNSINGWIFITYQKMK